MSHLAVRSQDVFPRFLQPSPAPEPHAVFLFSCLEDPRELERGRGGSRGCEAAAALVFWRVIFSKL